MTTRGISFSFDTSGLLLAVAKIPAWLWLTVIAILFRFVNLGGENVWYDESFTSWVAKLPLSQMWDAVKGDVHPPLWYLIEWINVRLLGSSEFALRLPAALLGLCTVILVWHLALEFKFSTNTAFIAGLLAAILPGALYYSQEARMYTMLATFVLLATLAAIRGEWKLFTLAGIGAVYSQNLGVFYIATIGIAAAAVRFKSWSKPSSMAPIILAGAIIIVAWLPWAGIMLAQARQIGQGFWLQPLTTGGVILPLPQMEMGLRVAQAFQLHVYGAAMGASLVGLIACRKWLFTRSGAILLAMLLGAPLLIAAVSFFWRNVYLPRAMIPSAIGFMLLWAYILQHLDLSNRRVARWLLIPALAIALLSHYYPAQGARSGMRDWLAVIKEQWRPTDVVYHIALDSCVLSSYYLDGYPEAVKPEASDLNQSLTEPTKRSMGFNQVAFDDLAKLGYRRAWFIASLNPLTSAAQMAEVDRILAHYPHTLIKRDETSLSSLTIYQVDLWQL